MIWDPAYSFRRFSVRVAGLSPQARFIHVPYVESDPVVSERIIAQALA